MIITLDKGYEFILALLKRPIHSMFGMSEKELESATFCFTKTDGTCLQDIPALLGLRRASLVMSPAQVAMVY